MKSKIIPLFALFVILPFASAAHYIVGFVEDATDATPANDHVVVLWNPLHGISDNLTDIIGPNGNSGVNNIYMINCEELELPCDIGDTLNLQVIDTGDFYISDLVSVVVTGAGFDTADNMTLGLSIDIGSVLVDDSTTSPENEIDLVPAATKPVYCTGIASTFRGEDKITNASAVFYSSLIGNPDDNNDHYTNNSCSLNVSYGDSNEVLINCTINVWYYADSGMWNCNVSVQDDLNNSVSGSDSTTVNTLLALGLTSIADFGEFNALEVTDEISLNVTNYGNVKMNLSLGGYGAVPGDGLSMNCTLGETRNISIENSKFNITSTNAGAMDLSSVGNYYENLTSSESPKIRAFNLNYRQDDLSNDASNYTYWRMYVPAGVGGSCSGNVVFGAVSAPEN